MVDTGRGHPWDQQFQDGQRAPLFVVFVQGNGRDSGTFVKQCFQPIENKCLFALHRGGFVSHQGRGGRGRRGHNDGFRFFGRVGRIRSSCHRPTGIGHHRVFVPPFFFTTNHTMNTILRHSNGTRTFVAHPRGTFFTWFSVSSCHDVSSGRGWRWVVSHLCQGRHSLTFVGLLFGNADAIIHVQIGNDDGFTNGTMGRGKAYQRVVGQLC